MIHKFGFGLTLFGVVLIAVTLFIYCQIANASVTGQIPLPTFGTSMAFATVWAAAAFVTGGGIAMMRE